MLFTRISIVLVSSSFVVFAHSVFDAQECKARILLPVATATKNPKLNYQSGEGTDFLEYKVKNDDGGLFMNVNWSHGMDTLFKTRIPKGPTGWVCTSHVSFRHAKDKTKFDYGLVNTDFSQAYVDDPPPGAGFEPTYPKLVSDFNGNVADQYDNIISVHLQLESSYHKERKELVYTISSERGATPLMLGSVFVKPSKEALVVLWNAADSKLYVTELMKEKSKYALDTIQDKKSVSLIVKNIAENQISLSRNTAMIQKGNDAIITFIAPAYRVNDNPK